MYSRNTDRGGRRIKLPPGYTGSTFRHDTGEVRRYDGEMDMKIHSPLPEAVWEEDDEPTPEPTPEAADPVEGQAEPPVHEEEWGQEKKHETRWESLLTGLLDGLGSEEWLLFLVILLLVADGSDAWDIILLLCLLLAVR